MGFKLVRAAGPDSFGHGVLYGEQARKEIALCIGMYKEHLLKIKDMTWADARGEAMKYLPFTSAVFPWETEMIRGIASGAGTDFEDIMVLNTRYEILHYPKNECTAFALLRSATKEHKVLIGQNWDQRPNVAEHSIVLHLTAEDGTKIMGLTEAGQLLRNGMTSNGLGLAANSLDSSRDVKEIGAPANFMRMRALRSRHFGEMSDTIMLAQRAVSNNYCIASADDRAVDIEALPLAPSAIYPENGVLTHANHLLCNSGLDTSKGEKFRGERLGKILSEKAPDITVDYLKECLSDHEGYPRSVCSHIHGDATDTHKQWKTVASVIYDLDDLEMEVCKGNPCEGAYEKHRLNDY